MQFTLIFLLKSLYWTFDILTAFHANCLQSSSGHLTTWNSGIQINCEWERGCVDSIRLLLNFEKIFRNASQNFPLFEEASQKLFFHKKVDHIFLFGEMPSNYSNIREGLSIYFPRKRPSIFFLVFLRVSPRSRSTKITEYFEKSIEYITHYYFIPPIIKDTSYTWG